MQPAVVLQRSALAAVAALTIVVNVSLGVDWRLSLAAGGAVLVFAALTLRFPTRADRLLRPATAGHPLTRKELEVAVLVAQGKSNKAIAAQLFNSERTIENHVQHIYNKLNIDSRPQLALWVSERGLLPETIKR